MTLETFFEKFDRFADAPGAVGKMRELVLELAVRGRLLGKAFEVTDDWLPSGWHQKQLGEVAQFINGDRSKNYPSKSFRVDEGVPFINAGHLSNGDIDLTDMDYITPEHFERLGGGKVQHGDILYCLRGSLGKCAIVQSIDRGAIASSLLIIRPSQQIAPQFIYLFLTSPLGARMIAKYDNGSAQPNLSAANVKKYSFPLPPLAEQKRIVAKVDELMALCDRLEALQLEREAQAGQLARASLTRFADAPTPANLNLLFHSSFPISPSDLRKSILTLAVQGKLAPQDPNDESADALLEQILAERRKLKRTDAAKVKPLSAEDGLGYDTPASWRWQRLDDLLVFGPTNGFSPKAVDYETPVRSLTLSATTSGRFKGEHSKFITTGVPADSDLWLRDGDILVQRGNTIEYVGVAAVYRGKPNCFIYPDLMMKLRVASALDVGFIHLAMSHEDARDFLRARASGTSGSMPKINQTTLKSLPIPIPPLAEQRRIVAKVSELMALVDELETQLAASRTSAEKLLTALVAELTNN